MGQTLDGAVLRVRTANIFTLHYAERQSEMVFVQEKTEDCHFHHLKGTKYIGDLDTEDTRYGVARQKASTYRNDGKATLTNTVKEKLQTDPKRRVLQRPSYASAVTMNEADPRGTTLSNGQQAEDSQNFLDINRKIQQMQIQMEKMMKWNLDQMAGTKVCRCQAMYH